MIVVDAHYLAQYLGAPVWTDDQRLLRLLAGTLPLIQAIDTYSIS